MANTYTQLYIHFVFVVKFRRKLILPEWEERLFKYITGIVQSDKHKMICVNGIEDHIHVFVGMKPCISVSDLASRIKANSSKFINEENLAKRYFKWQSGFGAFSYSHSSVDAVYRYIMNQKEHHKRQSTEEEYKSLLKAYKVSYDEKYILDEEANE